MSRVAGQLPVKIKRSLAQVSSLVVDKKEQKKVLNLNSHLGGLIGYTTITNP